jgi:energy-coupling factor transport system ATP-binding protein
MSLMAIGVSHTYRRMEPGEDRALDGVSLTIDAGELVLLAGANGSGKTTLLQCLSGLLRPTAGRVAIDGVDATRSRMAAMSIQFPERALFAGTVYDDVAFGPMNMGMKKDEARERVFWALKAVGLGEELIERHPRTLSHGERRLAALAGTIAAGPRYLFLDEPTAGLDSRGKRHIVSTLTGLSKGGMAIVIASHDLEGLMGVCGRILALDGGRIAIDGKPDELLSFKDVGRLGLALPPSVLASRWLKGHGVDAPWNISPEALAGHLRRIQDEAPGMD